MTLLLRERVKILKVTVNKRIKIFFGIKKKLDRSLVIKYFMTFCKNNYKKNGKDLKNLLQKEILK